MSDYNDYVSGLGFDPSLFGGDSDSPTLVASTGKNDPNSSWGSGLLSFFTGATNTAGNVLTSLNQTDAQKKAAAATTKQAAATTNLTKVILLAVAGIAGLALVVMLFKRR